MLARRRPAALPSHVDGALCSRIGPCMCCGCRTAQGGASGCATLAPQQCGAPGCERESSLRIRGPLVEHQSLQATTTVDQATLCRPASRARRTLDVSPVRNPNSVPASVSCQEVWAHGSPRQSSAEPGWPSNVSDTALLMPTEPACTVGSTRERAPHTDVLACLNPPATQAPTL